MRLLRKKASLVAQTKLATRVPNSNDIRSKTLVINTQDSLKGRRMNKEFNHNKNQELEKNLKDFSAFHSPVLHQNQMRESITQYNHVLTAYESTRRIMLGENRTVSKPREGNNPFIDISEEGRNLEESMKEDMKNRGQDIENIGGQNRTEKVHQMTDKDIREAEEMKNRCKIQSDSDSCSKAMRDVRSKLSEVKYNQNLGRLNLEDAKPKNERQTDVFRQPSKRNQSRNTNTIGNNVQSPVQRDNRSTYVNHSVYRDNHHQHTSEAFSPHKDSNKGNLNPRFGHKEEQMPYKPIDKVPGIDLANHTNMFISRAMSGRLNEADCGYKKVLGSERELGQSGPAQSNTEGLRESLYPKSEQPRTSDGKTDVGKEADNESANAYKTNTRYSPPSSTDNPSVKEDAEHKPKKEDQHDTSGANSDGAHKDNKNDNRDTSGWDKRNKRGEKPSRKISNMMDGGESKGF